MSHSRWQGIWTSLPCSGYGFNMATDPFSVLHMHQSSLHKHVIMIDWLPDGLYVCRWTPRDFLGECKPNALRSILAKPSLLWCAFMSYDKI